jgi:hypothetical protein
MALVNQQVRKVYHFNSLLKYNAELIQSQRLFRQRDRPLLTECQANSSATDYDQVGQQAISSLVNVQIGWYITYGYYARFVFCTNVIL